MADPGDIRASVTAGLEARAKWRDDADASPIAVSAREPWPVGSHRRRRPTVMRWDQRIWPDLMKATEDLGELMNKPLARIVRVDPTAQRRQRGGRCTAAAG